MTGQDAVAASEPPALSLRAVTNSIVGLITIIAFETMAVSTAMPAVGADLHAGAAYGLVFSLMFTGQLLGIVLAGAWAQERGPLPPLIAGMALFAAGSTVSGVAGAFAVLLAGRLIAGVGAGLTVVSVYVLIGAVYPIASRPRVFGWVSAAWVVPSVAGPVVAAALTQALGWRAVFLIVVPLTLLAIPALGRVRLMLTRSGAAEYAPDAEDGPAVAAMPARRLIGLGALIALSAALFQGATSLRDMPSAAAVALAVLGLAGLAWAVPQVMPPGTLRMRRGQPSVMLSRFLLMGAFEGVVAFAPLMLHDRRGLSLMGTGALLAVASLGWAGGSFVQSRPAFAEKGARLVLAGALLLAAAILTVLGLDLATAPLGWFAPSLAALGLAMGIAVTSTSVLALRLAPPGGHAAASASLQMADVLGSVLGISVAGAAFAAATGSAGPGPSSFLGVWLGALLFAGVCIRSARRVPIARATGADAARPGGAAIVSE